MGFYYYIEGVILIVAQRRVPLDDRLIFKSRTTLGLAGATKLRHTSIQFSRICPPRIVISHTPPSYATLHQATQHPNLK
jgi:hypothetical protein